LHSISEKIYFNSPLFIQNILISVYGYKLYRERYTGNHKKYLQQLLASQFYSRQEVNKSTNESFLDIVRYAMKKVPFYRELYGKCGVSPDRINSIYDIDKLPMLSKEQIRQNPERFLADEFQKDNIITINTSGTTGKTLKVFVDYDARRYAYAFFSRLKKWAGINCKLANVTFAGRAIVSPDRNRPPFWRRNIKMNNYLFSSYHLSDANLGFYVKKLQQIQPHFIDSYPSSIYILAKYMLENNINGIYPKAIITSSETLLDFQRKTIEDVFQCPIFDQYGCAEQVVFISQCEKGTYHIHPEFGYVEFIREDGSKAEPGELARLICTGFTNRAMPLIRYDIGDTGILSKNQNCSCGRNFPVIEKILGRTDDILVMRDGRQVGRLDPVFKGLQSIKETQIIQEDLDNVILKIVPGENYNDNEADIIVYELKKRLGSQTDITVEIVSEIPRTSSGKFRAVISKVKKV
jgi:phenylacetate-CoA ligase